MPASTRAPIWLPYRELADLRHEGLAILVTALNGVGGPSCHACRGGVWVMTCKNSIDCIGHGDAIIQTLDEAKR